MQYLKKERKSCQEPVTNVKMNLQGHQDRKYKSLNLLKLEDIKINLHVSSIQYLCFTFSSVCNVPISEPVMVLSVQPFQLQHCSLKIVALNFHD